MGHLLDSLKEKLHAHTHHNTTETTTTTTSSSDSAVHIQQHNAANASDSSTAAVNIHNFARSTKNVGPVVWNDQLANDATAWAQQLANEDKMHHSGAAGQGENLYWSSDDGSFEDAVNMWLKEGDKYHGEKIGEGNLGDWGHYTQAMWHSSVNVGMGKARAKNGGTYVVARYTPQGNMYGEKPY